MCEQHIFSVCAVNNSSPAKTAWPKSRYDLCGQICVLIFTVAKCGAIAGVSALAEARVFGTIQGLACGELVTGIANVRESAWIHQTGEPCCRDTKIRLFL